MGDFVLPMPVKGERVTSDGSSATTQSTPPSPSDHSPGLDADEGLDDEPAEKKEVLPDDDDAISALLSLQKDVTPPPSAPGGGIPRLAHGRVQQRAAEARRDQQKRRCHALLLPLPWLRQGLRECSRVKPPPAQHHEPARAVSISSSHLHFPSTPRRPPPTRCGNTAGSATWIGCATLAPDAPHSTAVGTAASLRRPWGCVYQDMYRMHHDTSASHRGLPACKLATQHAGHVSLTSLSIDDLDV